MPGKVKVKILAGRNLPVMDRSSDTTDAYVEIKLGNTTYKTDVYRKSLNPQWNSDWYKYEVDDSELQDEPLQIRLMDHDTYSANDAIGKVYLDLNPLLLPSTHTVKNTSLSDSVSAGSNVTGGATMAGWIPVFDTMHGIRGEVNIIVKVELFSDFNKFRQSSCGVQFFCSPVIPHGYHAQVIHGFVEELVVNDDPEYQWIDKIRTPRASNEARQTLFFKLSGEVQRKIGLKALDLGGNAVIGYHQCFDLEGESGIVVRGIGTAVTLTRIADVLPPVSALEPADDMISSKPNATNSSVVVVEGYRNLIQNICLLSPHSVLVAGPLEAQSDCLSRKLGRKAVCPKTTVKFLRHFDSTSNEPKFRVKVFPAYLSADYNMDSVKVIYNRKMPQYSRHLSYTYEKKEDLQKGLDIFRGSTQSLATNYNGENVKQLINKHQIPNENQSTRNNAFLRAVKSLSIFNNRKWKTTLSTLKGKLTQDGYSNKKSQFKLQKQSVFPSKLLHPRNRKTKHSGMEGAELLSCYVPEDISVSSTLENSFPALDSVMEVTESSASSLAYQPVEVNVDEPGTSELMSSYLRLPRPDDGPELQYVDGHLMSNISDLTSSSASSTTDDDVSEFSYKDEENCQLTDIPFSSKGGSELKMELNVPSCISHSAIELYSSTISTSYFDQKSGSMAQEDGTQIYNDDDVCREKEQTDNWRPTQSLERISETKKKKSCATVGNFNNSPITSESLLDLAFEDRGTSKNNKGSQIVANQTHHLNCKHKTTHFTQKIPFLAITDTSDKSVQLGRFYNMSCDKTRRKSNSWPNTQKTFLRYFPKFRNRSIPDFVSVHCTNENSALLHCTDGLFSACRQYMPSYCTAPARLSLPMVNTDLSCKPHSFTLNNDVVENCNSTLLVSRKLEKAVSMPTVVAPCVDLPSNISLTPKTRIASSVSSVSVMHATNFVESPSEDLKHHNIKHGPCLVPISRHVAVDEAANSEKTAGVPISAPTGSRISPSPAKIPVGPGGICRRSSDSDLSITPKGNSLTGSDRSSNAGCHFRSMRPTVNQDNMEMLEYPFLTMRKYGPGFIQHLGGTISARSVKLLERITNLDEPESRDSWWTEIRMEVRSHARAIGCNVVLGYSEHTSICDDVCVLSASGTAAFIHMETGENSTQHPVPRHHLQTKELMTTSLDRTDFEKDKPTGTVPLSAVPKMQCVPEMSDSETPPPCTICHIPYSESSVPFRVTMLKCAVCGKGKVPDVLLTTIEPPEGLPTLGKGAFLQAHVCRPKRVLRGELNAKEISDGLPFLEYELHRLLLIKLKLAGMNSIFGLKVEVAVGEKMMIALATGTALFLAPLPVPPVPKISCANPWTDEKRLNEIQKKMVETVKKNREAYHLKNLAEPDVSSQGKVPSSENEESDDERPALELSTGNKDTWIFEIDDSEDVDKLSVLIDPRPPEGFHTVNIESVPGLDELEVVRNLQMFTQVWRAKISSSQTHIAAFSNHINRLLQSVYFKLRRLVPCALCNLEFRVELPEIDEVQLSVLGMAIRLSDHVKATKVRKKVPAPLSKEDLKKLDEGEMIFSLEEYHDPHVVPASASVMHPHQSSTVSCTGPLYKLSNILDAGDDTDDPKESAIHGKERYGVDITPLSHIPGAKIDRYLGNLNFFFIRESTSIREAGGLSGFVHSFVTEVLAIVRAHVTALGGNAMVSYFMSECVLYHNPHKNQGQCLINVGGDVVSASYYTEE